MPKNAGKPTAPRSGQGGAGVPGLNSGALDRAFEALGRYDAGSSRGSLQPIDDAVRGVLSQAEARPELEGRLVGVLGSTFTIWAKQYACSKLRIIGGSDSVKALAGLLADRQLADAARDALESVPGPEVSRALRDALPKLEGDLKLGVIHSLGSRRDAESVPALARLLSHADQGIVSAAAAALGEIGTEKAARALGKLFSDCPDAARLGVADAGLACAEHLWGEGHKSEAERIWRSLGGPAFPQWVRDAAARRLGGGL